MSSTEKKRSTPFKKRQRRMLFLGFVLPAVIGATVLALVAISQTSVYAYAPSELAEAPRTEVADRQIRLGGVVKQETLRALEGTQVAFTVTDFVTDIPVLFDGALPGLVTEGEGVVAQGRFGADGIFIADNVLARHDENYMAPEVAEALKRTGRYEEYKRGEREGLDADERSEAAGSY